MKSEKSKAVILKALNEENGAIGSLRLARILMSMGLDLQPRIIRIYLRQLDEQGFTRLVSRRGGRMITDKGKQELERANVMDKIGMVAAKVDTLGYSMTFRGKTGGGSIIINLSLVAEKDFPRAWAEIRKAFANGYAMGTRVIIARPGESLVNVIVPEKMLAIGTVCSVTLNGVLLHECIPVTSRFGGLLEINQGQPTRFVQAIEYRGSSLDPLEAFIKADMTSIREVIRSGSGLVGASFREVPSVTVNHIKRVENRLADFGLNGITAIGKPNQPLFDIPVSEGYTGLVISGGLNPIAAAYEAGIDISIHSLDGLQEFDTLSTFTDIAPSAAERK